MNDSLCQACDERPVDHPSTGECHRCLQRRWARANPHHNRREGKRAEQKRAWDRAAAKRKKAARLSDATGTTSLENPKIGPGDASTSPGRGSKE